MNEMSESLNIMKQCLNKLTILNNQKKL